MLLINCHDIRIMVSAKKEKFIKDRLGETNYKAMREVLKCIFLVMNAHALANKPSDIDFSNLRPFEEVVIGYGGSR